MQAKRLGEEIRVGRATSGLTRDAAAARAGIAPSTWDRLEAGAPSASLATIAAATESVGLDLVCQAFPGRGPSLRDSGQLAIAEHLRALASPMWRVSLEEPAGDHGEAIDQVFWGSREVVATEIERRMVNWQAQLRRAKLKRAWLAERTQLPVRLVIAIEDTRRNREVMAVHAPLISTALPMGSRNVLAALRSGEPLGADGICWIRAPARARAGS
jgi:transcriptional regulator with XRE-family HTH domain